LRLRELSDGRRSDDELMRAASEIERASGLMRRRRFLAGVTSSCITDTGDVKVVRWITGPVPGAS
jgi:hypothetical protein